jgi:hypothetical protein
MRRDLRERKPCHSLAERPVAPIACSHSGEMGSVLWHLERFLQWVPGNRFSRRTAVVTMRVEGARTLAARKLRRMLVDHYPPADLFALIPHV